MVTKAIMSITRQIPAGAEFTVEACNNGNDDSPTWEDVTQAVTSGSKFFLSQRQQDGGGMGIQFPNQGEAEQRKRGLLHFFRGR